MNIRDGYETEIAIPSIAIPENTSRVVLSNELLKELQGSGRSEFYDEERGTSSIKETCANPLSFPPPRASLNAQRTIFTNERKWKVIHAHSSDEEYLAVAASKMVTTMLRDYDQDERQTDGSRHWDTIRRVLLKAFAQGARDSMKDFGFT